MNKFLYTSLVFLVLMGCKSDPEPEPSNNNTDCSDFSPVFLYYTTDDFCGQKNGTVFIEPDVPVAEYSIDDGVTFQDTGYFEGLTEGIHYVVLKDENGCTNRDSIMIYSSSGVSFTASTVDAGCFASNGEITVTATGTGGYTYSIDGGDFVASNNFTGLSSGSYIIQVADSTGCLATETILVGAGDVSYSTDVSAIFTATCTTSGCHDGNSGIIGFTSYNNVKNYASRIKSQLNSGGMPMDTTISSTDKQTIICWINDGAPNN